MILANVFAWIRPFLSAFAKIKAFTPPPQLFWNYLRCFNTNSAGLACSMTRQSPTPCLPLGNRNGGLDIGKKRGYFTTNFLPPLM